ncbi:response regulator transcription factor [[Eubacterium] tenue]|nr:response regulator transcription factor [[Eubacterium] tenue]MBC8632005.1 response regulator transcription factor [[Eubacterium] tenue]
MEVLIISKSFIVREALKIFFGYKFKENNIECLRDISEVKPIDLSNTKVIFIDIEKNNIEHAISIKQYYYFIKLIVFDRENNEDIFIKSMNNGIDGYIADIAEKDDLDYIVSMILRGRKFYDTQSFEALINNQRTNKYDNVNVLTTRENEVLQKVGKGYSNKEIAKDLHITEHTVKKHISNILVKLDMRNRKDLIIYTKEKINNNLKFAQ